MASFIIGLFIGGVVGVFTVVLCVMSREYDECNVKERSELPYDPVTEAHYVLSTILNDSTSTHASCLIAIEEANRYLNETLTQEE